MKRSKGLLGLFGCGIILVSVISCGGGGSSSPGGSPSDAKSVVTAATYAATVPGCANGGIQLDAGIDVNGNGVLDQSEVASSQYVCNGLNGLATLVSVVTEAAGTNCITGGKKVSVGLDTNLDGVLDPAEITSFNFICNGMSGSSGTNGLISLVSVTVEPAGANCANGGKKVSTGQDDDSDGILDASEVTASSYVCNGTNGSSGTNGLISLVSVTTEPAGANCANGGKKVSTGLDDDASGVLDASEVDATNYLCNGNSGLDGTNGANGLSTLVTIITEVTATCPFGGLTVTSGLDANDSGTLDSGEVTSTNYVCSGATGPAGPPGPGITWVDVTAVSVQAGPNTGYLADSSSLVTITLPDAPSLSIGDIIEVSGIGSGGWKIAQNVGQSIIVKNLVGNSDLVWPVGNIKRNWKAVASSADGVKLVAVEYGGQIYISGDSGVTWTARDVNRNWNAVASSSDGMKLAAVNFAGRIYLSVDSGATWTPAESSRQWSHVASSADGTKLVATVNNGQIYTSTDSGLNWTPRNSTRYWSAVASSSTGTHLVAVVNGGQIYTSTDSGLNWTPRESVRNWSAVASSSDGAKLVAADYGGQIYTSADYGVTWNPKPDYNFWQDVASSSDGSRLVAVVSGGRIYTSDDSGSTWFAHDTDRDWSSVALSSDGNKIVTVVTDGQIYTSTIPTSTVGAAGSISGGQYDAIELQYVGSNKFIVLAHEGYLIVE